MTQTATQTRIPYGFTVHIAQELKHLGRRHRKLSKKEMRELLRRGEK